MVKQKTKLNLFDIVIAVIVIAFIIIVAASYNNQHNLGDNTVFVEVKISDQETIENVTDKLEVSDEVYFSGTKYPVEIVNLTLEQGRGESVILYITLMGPGEVIEGKSIFNGQRIYLNQKVEIRADYFIQGLITNYYES